MKKLNSTAYAFALEAQKPPTPPTVDDPRRPLNVMELSRLIGWSRTKIEKLRNAGVIPCHRIGKSYPFYYLDEVLDALKASETTSTVANA